MHGLANEEAIIRIQNCQVFTPRNLKKKSALFTCMMHFEIKTDFKMWKFGFGLTWRIVSLFWDLLCLMWISLGSESRMKLIKNRSVDQKSTL